VADRVGMKVRVERVLLGGLMSALAFLLDRRLRKLQLRPAEEIGGEPDSEDAADDREADRDPAGG
jgi:hypothetical protein